MNIEHELLVSKFRNEQHKNIISLIFHGYILRKKEDEFIKKYGVSFEQFNVLRIINGSERKRLTVKEIAVRMIEKNSNVPRIVDKLEIKKMVTRENDKKDKRVTFVSLANKGVMLLSEIKNPLEDFEQKLIKLNSEEAELLNNLLEKVF